MGGASHGSRAGTPSLPVHGELNVGILSGLRGRRQASGPVRLPLEQLGLSSALAAMAVPAFVLDADGIVAYWNDACAELTGLPAEGVIGTKDHWRGFYPQARPCLADLALSGKAHEISALYAAGDNESQSRLRARNWCDLPRGGRRYLLIDACKIFAPDGQVMGVLETLVDHTDIEKARLDMERARTEQGEVMDVLGNALQQLAGGDLSVRLQNRFPEDYEAIRSDFNESVSTLSASIAAVIADAEQIGTFATELSGLAESLAERVREQADNLDRSTEVVRSLTAGTQESMKETQTARDTIRTSAVQAREASATVARTVEAMQRIGTFSEEIERTIAVINDIAMQTNLLALNAGVEAARAGDQGLGFGVVAGEIRTLAQTSSGAGKSISDLVGQSGSAVQEGGELVSLTGSAFGSILKQIEHAESVMARLMDISGDQSRSLNSVSAALDQIDGTTKQNARLAEDTFKANKALVERAAELHRRMARFNVRAERLSGKTATEPSRAA